MESYILTTAANAGGNGQRYAYPHDVEKTRFHVEAARRLDVFLAVPNRDGEDCFYVNPDHVVAVYPKEA